MVIGGMFELEKPGNGPCLERKNTIYTMSGRCALYACLVDMGKTAGQIAYVPAYTCETVLGSYLKAGYELRFYDVEPKGMVPVFKEEDLDGVGVLGICGYYGFLSYDRKFVELAASRGIRILLDTTHSIGYVDEDADYCAGSLRKWMGIASGGVAVKKAGPFSIELLAPEEEHIRGRYKAMEERSLAISSGDASYDAKAGQTFWETEMRLRKIFDVYASDPLSTEIAKHFDYGNLAKKRRDNYGYLMECLGDTKGFCPVFGFPGDDEIPSHFTIYADDREDLRNFLLENEIASTVYWPVPPMLEHPEKYPGASYIYSHVLSIQLDQRYGRKEMKYLATVLDAYSKKH